MICTRCNATGFLNLEQIEDQDVVNSGTESILNWIDSNDDHDVTICDCCGNSESEWYGEPGEHSYVGADWDTPDVPECI